MAALLCAAAAAALAWNPDHILEVKSGGYTRTARVHLPAGGVKGAVPLVVNYHTLCEDAALQESLTGFNKVADREGFVVAYPNGAVKGDVEGYLPFIGLGYSWNGGSCCPAAVRQKVDDVQFTRDLIDALEGMVRNATQGVLALDAKRRYATGASNGGFMVNRLACEAPELFAAFAPVAGVIGNGSAIVWPDDPFPCAAPAVPPPVLHFHGTDDWLVPWHGNSLLGFPSVPDYVATRKALAGVPAADAGAVTFKSGEVECTAYGGAASNFTFCHHPYGHCWPGSRAQTACTLKIDATEEIWAFFKRYTRQ